MKDVPYKLRYSQELPKADPDVCQEGRMMTLLMREALGHFLARNNVYRNRFVDDGLTGILLRIHDKLQRFAMLLHGASKADEDEGLVENLLDVAVYALMGAMLVQFPTGKRGCQHLFSQDVAEDVFICVLCDTTISTGWSSLGGARGVASQPALIESTLD